MSDKLLRIGNAVRRNNACGRDGAQHRGVALAIACLLLAWPARAAESVTFNKDIAPILFSHCAVCHRDGEVAPFPLLTYRDARLHLRQIADLTARRLMPPWKPTRGAIGFLDDRSLSDAQIQTIQQWVALGGPEGDPRDLPPPPQFGQGWRLGEPDLVVTMDAPYMLRPDGGDVFRTFVLPIPTDRVRYVRGIEFRPGNARAVHHANMGVDRTSSSRRLDALDPEVGYVGGMVRDAEYPPGYMLGWTPGQQPRPAPEGMPWRLEPHSDFVVQLHLQPTGKPELVQSSLALYFTDTAPTATPVGLRLGSQTIDIPPGEPNYTIDDTFVVPVDVDLFAVQPHAHNLGRTVLGEARLPDGSVQTLIDVPDWDFRWQDVYRFAAPLRVPRGTVLSVRIVYDNSPGNPRNPFQPPHRIVWGQNTSDEMGDLWIQMVPVRSADLDGLVGSVRRKSIADDLAAYTKVMETDPDNPLRHDAVALLLLQAGRIDEAVARFRASVRLNPDSAPTRYNLGLALSMLRQYPEATREFEAAARLDPNHAEAHNNLGAMLHLAGRLDEAEAHYRRAFELRPENAEARSNLGQLVLLQGKASAATVEFEQALTIQPEAVSALTGLAWIRATTADPALRRPGQAVTLAERARQLSQGQDPRTFDALAAAYAALGEFDKATSTLRVGIGVAQSTGQSLLADDMRQRLQLYDEHHAVVR